MPGYVVVNATDGTFRVHRAGCADIMKFPSNGRWPVVAANVAEVLAREIADLNEDHGEGTFSEADFVVLPCVREAA